MQFSRFLIAGAGSLRRPDLGRLVIGILPPILLPHPDPDKAPPEHLRIGLGQHAAEDPGDQRRLAVVGELDLA